LQKTPLIKRQRINELEGNYSAQSKSTLPVKNGEGERTKEVFFTFFLFLVEFLLNVGYMEHLNFAIAILHD
jgi:hypothetical protein